MTRPDSQPVVPALVISVDAEARLRQSEQLTQSGSWELVPGTGELTHSAGFARLLGRAGTDTVDGSAFFSLVEREDRRTLNDAVSASLSGGAGACEFRIRRADGAVRTIIARGEVVIAVPGRPLYLRGAIQDVTGQREADCERLEAMSLARQGFDTAPIGMALVDPKTDRYIRANDVMCALLGRSRQQVIGATIDSVTYPDDRGDAERVAMLAGAIPSIQTEKRYLRPDGSIVWVKLSAAPVYRTDGSVQMFFSQVIDITERKEHEARFERDVNDAVWLGRIREAIDDDRLVLYSQPIVDLRTGETVQQELLLRMCAEDGSIVAPGDFLPVAERYGLISEIDRWVIRQAVAIAARGEAVEFNLSAMSVGDPAVLHELAAALAQTGADPELVVAEVTETAMMDQVDAGRLFAEQIAALGCRLALDDFGTGYASLSYLKQIPAQHLKIDIEFVRDLTRSDTDERLVRGIIGIAREFDQTTIAEGIEDQATLVRLRELGADFGQGYFLGRPEPLADAVPTVAVEPRPDTPISDPIGMVRAAFAAFSTRDIDIDAMLKMFHPDITLRPHGTSERVEREAPYRGHDGLRAYAKDVATVWASLKLVPTVFRLSPRGVIVFGHVDADSGTDKQLVDVLWVWGLRDGLISSVEVYQTPRDDPRTGYSGRTSAR